MVVREVENGTTRARAESLKGQTAIVTGASSGIGRAISRALAANEARLCLVGRRQPLLESLVEDIGGAGRGSYVRRADLTRDLEVDALAKSVYETLGGVDILVLCGGSMFLGATERASLDDFDRQYQSNLRAHYKLAQMFLPSLCQRQGQIVFINSSVARRTATAGLGQYAALQQGLRAVADSLRDEVNERGVRVVSIYPGRTATPRMEEMYRQRGLPYHPEQLMQPEDVAQMVIAALTLPRTAEVTDISMRPMRKTY